MNRSLLASLLLSAGPTGHVVAQLSLQAALGVRYTSTLVHDSIVAPFEVRPGVAPAIALTAAAPLQRGWAAHATLDFSTSMLERHDAGGATAELGRVSTLGVTIGVERRIASGVSVAAALGGLKYLPAEATGIFRDGTGGVLALASAAVGYAPPAAAAGRWHFGVTARYDVHRFLTPALRAEGFTSGRNVHRVALALQAGRLAR